MTDTDKSRSDSPHAETSTLRRAVQRRPPSDKDRFIVERMGRIREVIQEIVEEYGPEDPFAEHMARGWNIMRASVRAARREIAARRAAQPVDHDLEEERIAGEFDE